VDITRAALPGGRHLYVFCTRTAKRAKNRGPRQQEGGIKWLRGFKFQGENVTVAVTGFGRAKVF